MRVIAGKYKSRQLKSVKSNLTRPTTDRNKENMFNINNNSSYRLLFSKKIA